MRSLAIILAAAIAAPAAAELRVSSVADITTSFKACLKVTSASGFDPQVLEPAGWARATISGKDGAVSDGPLIYGHRERATLILLTPEERICTIMARLDSSDALSQLEQAWNGKFPEPNKDGMIMFSANGRPVVIRRTGTREKPALTISVLVPTETK